MDKDETVLLMEQAKKDLELYETGQEIGTEVFIMHVYPDPSLAIALRFCFAVCLLILLSLYFSSFKRVMTVKMIFCSKWIK